MPYCSPTEMAMEKASITPASVEPCLPSLRNTSPTPSSGELEAVMSPPARATENLVTVAGRCRGSRRRTGRYSCGAGTGAGWVVAGGAASAGVFLAFRQGGAALAVVPDV